MAAESHCLPSFKGYVKLEVVFHHLFLVHIKDINSIKGGIGIA